MKADRLLSLLLLLQVHQRLSAPELARRLEVSVRTIYRDVEGLGAAGIPVYAERGRYGGVVLLPGYRSDLSGLTAAEAQALFVFTGRGAAEDLGRGEALRRAVHKLLSVVPAAHRPDATRIAERIVVDASSWRRTPDAVPHLGALQDAVLTDRRLRIRYPSRSRGTDQDYPIDPYGLVVKAGVWYLLAGTAEGNRTFRVSRIRALTDLSEFYVRPPGLDVGELWQRTRDRVQPDVGGYPVSIRLERSSQALIERTCADQLLQAIETQSVDGELRTLRLTFRGFEHAFALLLSYGGLVEVLAPAELRASVASAVRAATALYDTDLDHESGTAHRRRTACSR